MDRERAMAALAAARIPGRLEQRMRGSAALPAALQRAVTAGAATEGGYWARRAFEATPGGVGALFAPLDDAALADIVGTLLPGLQPAVLAAWRALVRRPYPRGETRRPFRCPHHAGQLAERRGLWLLEVTNLLGDYDRDTVWVAEWAPQLTRYTEATELGWLLAGALDHGGELGDAVFAVLQASIAGGQPVAAMGRHVTQALMSCARPDAWAANEKLLLAAQRQEGLRQVILEAIDEAHPEAFVRMLRLIVDADLMRFAAVVRAFDVWFGFQWGTGSDRKIRDVLTTVLRFFDEPAARDAALAEAEAERAYLALWTLAFTDIERAVPAAVAMLADARAEKRFVAAHLLVQADWQPACIDLLPTLDDVDLRVAARALTAYHEDVAPSVPSPTLFTALERLIARVPSKPKQLTALVWPWTAGELGRGDVARAMLANRQGIATARLLPHAASLTAPLRDQLVRSLVRLGSRWSGDQVPDTGGLDAEGRAFLVQMLGDAAADVRASAFQALAPLPIEPDEVARLVELLARKAGDLRTLCLARLRQLPEDRLLAAADALLASADEPRRLGGLEILRDAVERGRATAAARQRATTFAAGTTPTPAMQAHLTAILGAAAAAAEPDPTLGLVDPAHLPSWPAPRALDAIDDDGARRCIEALAAVLAAHKTTEVRIGEHEPMLLLDAGWRMPSAVRPEQAEADANALPLRDTFHAFATRTAPEELLQGHLAETEGPAWQGQHARAIGKASRWGAARVVEAVLTWCLHWRPPAAAGRLALDILEQRLAALTDDDAREVTAHANRTTFSGQKRAPWEDRWRQVQHAQQRVRDLRRLLPDSFAAADDVRLYALARATMRRLQGAAGSHVPLDDFLAARAAGAFGEHGNDEFTDLLVGRFAASTRYRLLDETSARTPSAELAAHPALLAIVDHCRRRIVAIECQRGDRTTPATSAAMRLRWPGGLEVLQQALPALGAANFTRHQVWSWTGEFSRQDTLSTLVARSAPRPDDTPEEFAAWSRSAGIADTRLVELAAYAPQWAAHVAHVLGWPGLQSAIWWIQAHTKESDWNDRELRTAWAAQISEYTPLAADDLTDGAVDVTWFRAAHAELGAARWRIVYAAAKYASSSGGHRRAQRFADAMAGATTRAAVLREIDAQRQQDAVRALGLLPLADGDDRTADLQLRYRRLHEFARESRKFGSQRQASEKRAAALGLENLARTAGLRDPLRLQWAMERDAVADLAAGPVVVTAGDVTVQLGLDGDGRAELTVVRKGKALAAVPAALRKHAAVTALRERTRELQRQAGRVRTAFEAAMCRGDAFTGAELQELATHPLLWPTLTRLVFVGDDIAGYPTAAGKALARHDGHLEPVRQHEQLRLAHPHDLFTRGDWSAWQRECLQRERIQPFKQVFRELYPLTTDERTDGSRSRRYAGHQVQPKQALSLLGSRGWVTRPHEGVSRTFHAEGLVAHLDFAQGFYTPADVDGLTLESVLFTRRGEGKAVPLAAVGPRVFSEVMRDLDLVVSVAHRGGVDPEATASTVAMRAALLQQTCALLGLGNVAIRERHAVVTGALGEYSLHLGSAQVRLLGGPALCIVAVPSQHRGRLFLPFADDDPRTAEVLSKALLLARDREIQDPNILDQLRGPRR